MDLLRRLVKKLRSSADRKFGVPRIWSNQELRRFAHLFRGDIVNVSGWTDADKQGGHYRYYFYNASGYYITNYKEEQKGIQDPETEIYLDLEADIPKPLTRRFDVVFNHTVLEHVYNFQKAFRNLCELSKDVVIVVVPYIQQLHGIGYMDYWRFTPHAMRRLYDENGLKLRYCSANGRDRASIYLFCVGYRNDEWDEHIPERFDLKLDEQKDLYADGYTNVVGGNVI